ncbi:sensor histidine kinase [Chitinophaga sp. Mgbs1]|uniref:Sensor histidine kinase n=1 Tax=Chitinophaga solisilvae TaxID=1233460 RepID=A0A433WB81_9BACT|nr:sensor histidine kinase [Chitinophaga solisilvae]
MTLTQFMELTYSNKIKRILLHLLFWTAIGLSAFYFSTISLYNYQNTGTALLIVAKNTLALVVFFYPLMYFIVPRWLLRKKYLAAAGGALLLFLLHTWIDSYFEQVVMLRCAACMAHYKIASIEYYDLLRTPALEMMKARLTNFGVLYALMITICLPVSLKLARSYFRQTIRQLELSRNNLQLEFNFLKSQVNPHFLFNTLNNIYSLVENDKKKQATTTIARLSDFMRYTLYESDSDAIPLAREIQLLQDYIALEKIRLNQTVVDFRFDSDQGDYHIPPLLLMPAVENAFKYVDDNTDSSYIRIQIQVENGFFRCLLENSFDPGKITGTGGIGLTNLQKRLKFHFRDAYAYIVAVKEYNYSLTVSFKIA